MWAVIASVSEGAEAAKEVINPVIPEVSELVWGAIAFFVLYLFMQFVGLPPLRAAMRQRDEQIRADLESAERVVSDAEQVRRDYEATIAQARADAARLVDDARHSAESVRSEQLRAAESAAAETKSAALAELDGERTTALHGLSAAVTTVAVGAASKVLGAELAVEPNAGIVADHLNETR